MNIEGTNSGETLNGSGGRDFINGRNGDDTINGNGGDDYIDGGDGADTVTDFQDGMDKLWMNGQRYKKFAKIKVLAKNVGDDMILDLGGGHVLKIKDFSKSDFNKSDVELLHG